jgi:hypothetical protein
MKPGFCHCCGIFVTELTDEHAPPLQTQNLIPPQALQRNSMTRMREHNLSKRRLPPALHLRGCNLLRLRRLLLSSRRDLENAWLARLRCTRHRAKQLLPPLEESL